MGKESEIPAVVSSTNVTKKSTEHKRPKLQIDVEASPVSLLSPAVLLKPVSPLSPGALGKVRLRRSMKGKGRKKWAKAEVGTVNHKFPLMDALTDVHCPHHTSAHARGNDLENRVPVPIQSVGLLRKAVAEGWTLEKDSRYRAGKTLAKEASTRPISGVFSNLPEKRLQETSLETETADPGEQHDSAWYKPDISREDAASVLESKPTGSFIIRKSTSRRQCYALALKSPPKSKKDDASVTHYLVRTDSQRRLLLNGSSKKSPTLNHLVSRLCQTPDLLPCKLRL